MAAASALAASLPVKEFESLARLAAYVVLNHLLLISLLVEFHLLNFHLHAATAATTTTTIGQRQL